MKTNSLLPHSYKRIGWIILMLSPVFWFITFFYQGTIPWLDGIPFFTLVNDWGPLGGQASLRVNKVNLTWTLIGVLFIVGGLMVAFSKEKIEDEYIMQLRLRSFQWAVLINYTLLLIAFLLVFGLDFITVLAYNVFTMLALFIIRFHYLLNKISHEE